MGFDAVVMVAEHIASRRTTRLFSRSDLCQSETEARLRRGRKMQRQDPRVVTTPAQEAEIIEAVKRKEPYRVIAARLGVSRACVGRVWQRTLDRALAEPVAPCGPPAVDPHTGIEHEVTDELILGSVMRDLARGFRLTEDLGQRLQIADRLPKLALARHRIREPSRSTAQTGKQYTVLASPDDWPEPPQTAQVHWINLDK